MTTAEYSYVQSRGRDYPVITFHIRSANIETDADALIDSGANISIFRLEMADLLDIKIEGGLRSESVGIGGKIEVFVHELELKVFDKWFPCRVGFSKQLTTSFNILGREGFFDMHLVTFNEKEKKTIITEF